MSKDKKKILITGHKGFVGSALVKKLTSKNIEIVLPEISGISINLCNKLELDQIEHSDIIVHLAARSYVPDSFNYSADFYENNILSTLNLLEKAKRDKSKMIFFSTYVYGRPEYLPLNEDHRRSPLNPYTQSKVLCEDLCLAYNRDFGVPVTIFRPFNIYGPGQKDTFFIPTIINQLDNEVILLKDPRPQRDFIYIEDVISALEADIFSDILECNIYNLGFGVSTSIKEVLLNLILFSNSKADWMFSEEYRQGEVLDTVADITRIKEKLGWEPRVNLKQGLMQCVKKCI